MIIAGYGLAIVRLPSALESSAGATACSSSRLLVVGMVIAVGPVAVRAIPTPLGRDVQGVRATARAWVSRCAAPARAVPLVVLALTVLLGLGLNVGVARRCAGAVTAHRRGGRSAS